MTDHLNEARERVLNTAERLFTERGYAAVTLRDIADALGMRQASLYYHAPGGKEELFVTVTERSMARHRAGIETAMAEAGSDLQAQLKAAAGWLLSQPPIDWPRMMRSDMPAISPAQAARLTQAAGAALMQPLQRAFVEAGQRERLTMPQPEILAGSFLIIISALHDTQRFTNLPKEELANSIIQVFLNGIRPRVQER